MKVLKKKHQVNIMDYDYLRDVNNRIFLSSLSTFDVFVLDAILYSPLHTSLEALKEYLLNQDKSVNEKQLQATLAKLQKIHLLTITSDNMIQVNKELRKYFEINIQRFEQKDVPGISLVKELFRLLPTHLLMQWYDVSNFSNNIFSSIIERYLSQAHFYMTHLTNVQGDNFLYKKILDIVFSAPDFCVNLSFLQEELGLSEQDLQASLLHLEYNLACVLSYRQSSQNSYIAIVTPFAEWRKYLFATSCQPMKELQEPPQENSSTYLKDFSDFVSEASRGQCLDKVQQLSHSGDLALLPSHVKVAQRLGLIKIEENTIQLTRSGALWSEKELAEKQTLLFQHMHFCCLNNSEWHSIYINSTFEITKKVLLTLPASIWFSLSELINSIVPLCKRGSSATLVREHQQWQYTLPNYPESFYKFLTLMIKLHFFHSGMIKTAVMNHQEIFCVTPLGKKILYNE